MGVASTHAKLDCYSGTVNGLKVRRLLRDSGSNISFVHPRLVPKNYRDEGSMKIETMDNHVFYRPTTTVDLRVQGIHAKVRMAVDDTLTFDALMGKNIPGIETLQEPRLGAREPRRRAENRCPKRKCNVPRNYRERTTSVESDDSGDSPTELERAETSSECTTPESSSESESASQAESPEDIPHPQPESDYHLSDDAFEKADQRRKLTRAQKRRERQQYAQTWGEPVPLDGGIDQLKKAQEDDPSLIRSRRTAGQPKSQFFWSKEGVLYRHGTLTKHSGRATQLVLPGQYREKTLRMAHIAPLAGYFGTAKTLARIKQRFFWPDMTQDVKDLCRRCQICQKTAPKCGPRAPLIPLPIIRTPFTRLAMDMVGPLPPTDDGHKYILTVCDYGTRYLEAFPLKSTTSQDVAEALIDLFARTGIPDEILTDRGANFCSELMTEFLKLLGVRSIKTSAYHPETDGMVERFNGTLKAGLRKYIEKFEGQWHKALPYILFAYREIPHSTTGFSPFELLFGKNPRGPLDVLKSEWTGTTSKSENVVSFLTDTYERLESARALATQSEETAKAKMKTYYDKAARLEVYSVGDLVQILKPTTAVKLTAQWQGPFTIVRKLSDTTY